MRKPYRIKILYPVPYGEATPIGMVDALLLWIDSNPTTKVRDMVVWLADRYKLTHTMAQEYANTVLRLLLWRRINGDGIALTQLGEYLLTTDLRQKQQLLAWQFLTRCLGTDLILEQYAKSETRLADAQIIKHIGQVVIDLREGEQVQLRIDWFEALGCLRRTQPGVAEITEMGRDLFKRFANDPYTPLIDFSEIDEPELGIDGAPHAQDELTTLIEELTDSATDGRNPKRLELAVMGAFRYLGFQADHLGKPGEGDVLIRADIGSRSYKVVGDGKARQGGKVQMLDFYTLVQHCRQEGAQYGVVVAGGFSESQLVRNAQENGIVLMRVSVLIDWLRFHTATPLNLSDYQIMFTQPGLMTKLPLELTRAAAQRERLVSLLVSLIEQLQMLYQHGMADRLTPAQMLPMLVMRQKGMTYTDVEIQQALALLAYPAIGGVIADGSGVDLVVSRRMLAHIFRSVADQMEADRQTVNGSSAHDY